MTIPKNTHIPGSSGQGGWRSCLEQSEYGGGVAG